MPRGVIVWTLIGFLTAAAPAAADDLFAQEKPDAGIAMIHFPQSLAVIHAPLAGAALDPVFLDPAPVSHSLKKTDPARLVPAKIGPDLNGPVTREALAQAARESGADILLVYRYEMPDAAGGTFRVRGMVYFAAQKKVIPLASSESEASGNLREANEAALKQLAEAARKAILSWKFEKRRSNY